MQGFHTTSVPKHPYIHLSLLGIVSWECLWTWVSMVSVMQIFKLAEGLCMTYDRLKDMCLLIFEKKTILFKFLLKMWLRIPFPLPHNYMYPYTSSAGFQICFKGKVLWITWSGQKRKVSPNDSKFSLSGQVADLVGFLTLSLLCNVTERRL